MKAFITIIQMAIAVALVTLVLLQSKGVGLGKAWGGSGEFYKNRRGVEKILFQLTVLLVVLFLISSLLSLLIT